MSVRIHAYNCKLIRSCLCFIIFIIDYIFSGKFFALSGVGFLIDMNLNSVRCMVKHVAVESQLVIN